MRKDWPPDVEATITFGATLAGGRRSAARSGIYYRPQFFYEDWDHEVGSIDFVGQEWVQPGETVTAQITLLHADTFLDPIFSPLAPGKQFSLREGWKVVATGTVTKILNLHENVRNHPPSARSLETWKRQKAERAAQLAKDRSQKA